jgi:hypothetical protein
LSAADLARERIATVAVTLRAFTRATGAEAAILLLDRGDARQPFVVECPAEGLAVLAEGEHTVELDPDRLAAEPLPLPALRPLGAVEVDALRAQLTSPLGAVEQLARGLRELAGRFPGRSVLSATFTTSDPATPLQLAARTGDPLVLALGEEQFEMAPGWPA